ncbi:MAG: hypothetical protein HC884_04495 [Chloroflexaceae bacterium]|nr:hypothetical protein [Chloroflexaceae bacterium]
MRWNPQGKPNATILFFTLLIGVAGLVPRVTALDDFLTYDEAYHWIGRTERFFDALVEHHWAGTRQTGHPGVTTMWGGSLGLALEHLAVARGWVPPPTPLEHLAWLRLPLAVLHSLLVAVSYVLLRRLVTPLTALFAAWFWAACPFLIAHARVLHMDALLADL